MDKFFDIYDRAEVVVLLWILSAMLPLLIINPGKSHLGLQLGGISVFSIIVVSLYKFRNKKKMLGNWAYSDLFVYVLFPVVLFSFYSYVMIFGDVK